ncbi:MAG: helix-turn-helix domain-containing protein [Clostridia bacterium]|nr:helix-turn-helix domain-containing protein [Clostridia bacterium]
MDYQAFSEFLDNLEGSSRVHICMLDVSGMMNGEYLALPSRRWSHSGPFCSAAKTTPKGLSLCLACKGLTNRKAIEGKVPFWGTCPYGLSEVVWPVCREGAVKSILFVGNLVLRGTDIRGNIQKACRLTGVSQDRLLACLPQTQAAEDIAPYQSIAGSVASYLSLLSEHVSAGGRENHWAVNALREYVNCHYDEHLTLEGLAKIYFLNEKYLGRLFVRQTGMTFHQYLNQTRLKHCAKLLRSTNKSVLEIALACGFGNVTYCNRLFLNCFGCSPGAYRKKYAGKPSEEHETDQ